MATSRLPPAEPELLRHRFPTLVEVLHRKTVAPLDLYSFYIYMRDQQRSVDYLDFWLDVSQHLVLCRSYVRYLRHSLIDDTPDLDASKRSSHVLPHEAVASGSKEARDPDLSDQRLSAFLRSDESRSRQHSPQTSQGSAHSAASAAAAAAGGGVGRERPPRPSFATLNAASAADSSSPGQTSNAEAVLRREDLKASAEKILYTYLLPGSEREIIIPQAILHDIQDAIEGSSARVDPEMFDLAKDYVFQAMERDAFPGFLQSKGLGNLIPQSMMARLMVGLVVFFGAFWTAFALIFLHTTRATRCWLILPFTLALYLIFTHQYMLDPVLAMLGYSEYTLMHFNRIREPYVQKTLVKRAVSQLAMFLLVDAAVCSLFVFVPGKRL